MAEDTKTCSLTEDEIKKLIIWHGYNLNDEGRVEPIEDMETRIDRINYLNRRLKAEKKDKVEEQPKAEPTPTLDPVKATW